MENFNEITSIWQTNAPAYSYPVDEVKKVMQRYSQKKKSQNIAMLLLAALLLIALIYLIQSAEFKMWSSYLGLSLFAVVALKAVHAKMKGHEMLTHLEELSNQEFLKELEQSEQQSCVGKARRQAILFVVWALGFSFYIYEIVWATNYLLWSYVALSLFIAFVWWVYRPFIQKRYQKASHDTITHIQHLTYQIYENE